jgi:acyl-CoA dehydrogenase
MRSRCASPETLIITLPNVALRVVDRAIQIHCGLGLTEDAPLAGFWAHLRAMRIADGPDEVHKRTIARQELRKQRLRRDGAAGGT